jgi:5-methyltetrahydrofolate--homocysteine methyltransferase
VIYGKDAFSDLHFMDKLMPAKQQSKWDNAKGFLDEWAEAEAQELASVQNEAGNGNGAKAKPEEQPKVIDTRRSEAVAVDIPRPLPPFWGTQVIPYPAIAIAEVFPYLDLQALFAGQWQFRKPKDQSREDYDAFLAEKVYPVLDHWKEKVVQEQLLHPTVIYGYFPCQSEGNSLLIYDPALLTTGSNQLPEGSEPIWKLDFPRQRSGHRLCIADFFAPKESGQVDVFAMQAVTVGEVATAYAKTLFEANEYTDYLYYHGIAVQTAEALAEWTHARVRRELGFGDLEPDNIREILQQHYPGSRYSFGYPACPNIQDQYRQLELLQTERINLFMDESEQIYPEQSTTAIITYHPFAKYFSA